MTSDTEQHMIWLHFRVGPRCLISRSPMHSTILQLRSQAALHASTKDLTIGDIWSERVQLLAEQRPVFINVILGCSDPIYRKILLSSAEVDEELKRRFPTLTLLSLNRKRTHLRTGNTRNCSRTHTRIFLHSEQLGMSRSESCFRSWC